MASSKCPLITSGWCLPTPVLPPPSTSSDLHWLLGSGHNICFGKESNLYSLIYSGERLSNISALITPPCFPGLASVWDRWGRCGGPAVLSGRSLSSTAPPAPSALLRLGSCSGLTEAGVRWHWPGLSKQGVCWLSQPCTLVLFLPAWDRGQRHQDPSKARAVLSGTPLWA